ncbi:hypothetical protein FJTKL_12016 [Diaporthe vaccinii]|uniref:GTP-binding protein ypt4 n=1 Tax=Diaporthe vaccinii TaxID=105482 RepID=A0ABR4FAW2_9PEZI
MNEPPTGLHPTSNTACKRQRRRSPYKSPSLICALPRNSRSCLLHRFVKNEWRVLSSQTIGVEFATKIIKVGTGARRKRIKLQLWDTAGTERFRSVSRSYYRGAAGAILVYDITSHASFHSLQPFLNDARALASPNLTLVLAGNKLDLADSNALVDTSMPPPTPSSYSSSNTITAPAGAGASSYASYSAASVSSTTSRSTMATMTDRDPWGGGLSGGAGHEQRATIALEGREVSATEASRWASGVNVPVTMEVSALNGEGVDEVFGRLARMILTKIELGEIDPDDPMSGIQYGDAGGLWHSGASTDGASIKSSLTTDDIGAGGARRRGRGRGKSRSQWGMGGMREWEEVFTLSNRRSRRGCC